MYAQLLSTYTAPTQSNHLAYAMLYVNNTGIVLDIKIELSVSNYACS